MNRKVFNDIFLGLNKLIWFCFFVLTIFSFPENIIASELRVKSFYRADNDLSAILMKTKRIDDNDLVCAIIKVRSDINGLKFVASTPIVGNVEVKYGEYWIYVSEGTRQLSIYADGYMKLSYTFPERIEQKAVYVMEVTSVAGTMVETGKGNLIINSDPLNVEVRIDGFPDLLKISPCRFDNYRSGIYKFNFQKARYFPVDTLVSIDKESTKQIYIKLKPVWGSLIVKTGIPVSFQINGNNYESAYLDLSGEKNGLDEGAYTLTISRENYYDTVINVHIKSGDTTFLQVIPRPVKTKLVINSAPQGALVLVDGKKVGYTPFNGDFITGNHTVVLIRKGYIDERREIILTKNEVYNLTLPLRTNAIVKITSKPWGAKIYLNGQYKGKTPEYVKVNTGKNSLRLEKKNYKTIIKDITIVPDTTYSFSLKEKKYKLSLASSPANAIILINDKVAGTTPKSFSLPYGNYKVKIAKKGYVLRRKNFVLNNDKDVYVDMPKRVSAFVGAIVFTPSGDYDIYKIGGELGWSYLGAPHFLNSLGVAIGDVDDEEVDGRIKDWGLKKVSEDEYKDLHFNSLTSSDFAITGSVNIFWRFGWIIYKPFVFSLSTVMGASIYEGFDVYTAQKNYNPMVSINNPINKGDNIVNHYGHVVKKRFRYGLGLNVKFDNGYIGFDYWIPIDNKYLGDKFSFSIGFMF